MQYKLYSVYDEITQTFNLPFAALSEAEATRSFRLVVNDPVTLVHKSPQDYTLYYVGIYDDQKGAYTNLNQPLLVHKATSLLLPTVPSGE